MVRIHLAIDKVETPRRQLPDKMHEGNLGCVADVSEHGLRKKCGANRNPVDTANQPVCEPCLCRVCEPELMKDAIGVPHGRGNPRTLLTHTPGRGAGANNPVKRGVEPHSELALSQSLCQAPAYMQVPWNEHRAGVG